MSTMLMNRNNPIASYLVLFLTFFLSSVSGKSQNPNRHPADSLLFLLNTAPSDTNRVNLLIKLNLYLNRMGEADNVIKYATEALELSQKLRFERGMKNAYSNLALAYSRKNDFDEALKYNFLCLNYAEKDGLIKHMGTFSNEIASIYYKQGRYQEALEYLLKAKVNWQKADNKDGLAFLNKNIGLIYEKFGQFDKALSEYYEALQYWQKGKEMFDSIYICDSYNLIGRVLIGQGKYKEAVKYFADELIIADKIQRAVASITAYRNFGDLNATQGNHPEALEYYMKALKIAENLKYANWIADLNNSIGSLYISQKNYDEALRHFRLAIEFNAKMSVRSGLSDVNANLGNLYAKQNLFDESLKYYIKAKEIAEEFNNKDGIYTANHNIGLVYYKQSENLEKSGKKDLAAEKLSTALHYQNAALEITQITSIRLQQAHAQIAIGSILCKQSVIDKRLQGKFKDGVISLNKGLAVAREYNDKELIKDAFSALYEAYNTAGDYENAFYYSNLYIKANDSLLNDQTSKKIEQVRIQYATEKAVNEEKMRQENEKREMSYKFLMKEDSIKFQQKLMSMQFMQQAFIAKQTEQELQLKQASLDLANKQNELNRLNYLKSQAELEAEQIKREEKENELTISNQEKSLQVSQLNLQNVQLNLKENQIQAQKRQRLFYIGGIALLVLLFVFIYRNIRNRQRTERLVATERLKTEKANAAHKMAELELQSLRAQLNPHFMFNSLNAIQELILKEDNDNSHLYLSRFSELLRMLLDNANQPFVSLRKEITLLELYLSLENLRIPDLKYSIELDPSIDDNKIAIPNMMLQPYIENAIWHGLSHKKGERNLCLRISRKGDNIVCEVEDNGVGRKMATELKSLYRKEHRSRGMELLSKRFNLLSKEYGSDIQTTIEDLHENGTATGTRVAITVPYSLTEQAKPVYS